MKAAQAPALKPSPRDAIRGLGVVYAGPLAVAAWWLASAGMAARAILTPASGIALPWLAGTLAAAGYYGAARRWMLTWGATAEGQEMPLAGDDLIKTPSVSNTSAITIDAEPGRVWSWLVQIGYQRGGWYSYDALEAAAGGGEFIEGHSATTLHEELQSLASGDRVWMSPWTGFEVCEVDHARALVLAIEPKPGEPYAPSSWAFVLRPEGDGVTRLLVRSRADYHRVNAAVRAVEHLTEAPHFVMQRKMLLGIKERAERQDGEQGAHLIDAIAPATRFRDVISVPVAASAEAILEAAMQVTAKEMPIARAIGTMRYLPGRLTGHRVDSDDGAPFIGALLTGGTVILAEEPAKEIVFGSAGKYHQLTDQEPRPFKTADDYHAFADPDYQQLVMSLRVEPAGTAGQNRLVLEHRTHPLSEGSARAFRRYWRLIKPSGAFVTRQLLQAIKRRAEGGEWRESSGEFR